MIKIIVDRIVFNHARKNQAQKLNQKNQDQIPLQVL